MSDRPKFIPRKDKIEICRDAGRRGGLKNGKRALPRVVRTIADTIQLDTEGEDRIRREVREIAVNMGLELKEGS